MRRITTLFLTTILVFGAGLPLAAQTEAPAAETESTAGLDGLRQWANDAIDVRLEAIADARAEVAKADHITPAHEAALLADLAAAEANLAGLADEVARAERAGELWTLLGRIAEETRVYVVLLPKVIGVSVSDAAVAIAAELDAVAVEVQAGIDAARASGFDVDESQRLLDQATAHVAEARRIGAPVADRMLALTPSDFPGTSPSVIEASIVDLETSFEQLIHGGEDLWAAFESLVVTIHS